MAWTMKAVSEAEPSVCPQLMSPGHLAEEEVLDAADEPGALLDPAERVQEQHQELLASAWLRPCHQRGGWTG